MYVYKNVQFIYFYYAIYSKNSFKSWIRIFFLFMNSFWGYIFIHSNNPEGQIINVSVINIGYMTSNKMNYF